MKLFITTKMHDKIPAWYYGKAYEIYEANKVVWTIIGFHTITKIFRYIYQAYNMYRGRKTWFDKQWLDAYSLGIRAGYFQRVEEESKNKYLLEELRLKLKLPNKGLRNETVN